MIKRRWFQFRLLTLLATITSVALCLAWWPALRARWMVYTLANNQVNVDGSYVGLIVRLDNANADQLRQMGPRATPYLLAALSDGNRFAAAHVLLTDINCREYSFSAEHWNQMRVSLYADGRIDFHPEQIPQLRQYWDSQVRPR
jgi:hypothetical protein